MNLIAVVADADMEWTLRTLLNKRQADLSIRPIESQVVRDPGRDAGVFRQAHNLLRLYLNQADYALVMLEREGSGVKADFSAKEMEDDIEDRLMRNGWRTSAGTPRAAAIVLDPELEIWVWSQSPHVARALGLTTEQVKTVLAKFPLSENGKPQRPKEAMLAALRVGRKPHSSRICQELAQTVSLQSDERAFAKLRHTLQTWFG